jgi:membrane-associated HD superfamily phosphohydrolase
MVEVSSLVAMIVVEVIIGLLVLSGLLVLFMMLRKGRIRKAATHLAERVKTDKSKREQRLKALLQGRYGYADAELEQTLHNMMQTEMLLYQNMINGFLKDDQKHLQQIDVDVENLVLGYQGLDVPESTGDVSPASASDDDGEITKLKEENERLSEELRVTMDTMGRMLNEYSTMFAGGSEVNEGAAPPAPEAPAENDQVDESVAQEQPEEPASIDPAPVEDTAVDEIASELTSATEIPDVSTEELQNSTAYEEPAPAVEDQATQAAEVEENASLDEDAAEADEEVSEIIDEVMEIADEMIEESEQTQQADAQEQTGESLVDDLETIDIEIPDADEALLDSSEAEAGSLEEEWAKLLEEDAENKKSD